MKIIGMITLACAITAFPRQCRNRLGPFGSHPVHLFLPLLESSLIRRGWRGGCVCMWWGGGCFQPPIVSVPCCPGTVGISPFVWRGDGGSLTPAGKESNSESCQCVTSAFGLQVSPSRSFGPWTVGTPDLSGGVTLSIIGDLQTMCQSCIVVFVPKVWRFRNPSQAWNLSVEWPY